MAPAAALPAKEGFHVSLSGRPYTWAPVSEDRRRLDVADEDASSAPAACWFANAELVVAIVPPPATAYLLSCYILDYDRDGRAMDLCFEDADGLPLDRRPVSAVETAGGIYVTWRVCGEVRLRIVKRAGTNVVVSGIFLDPVVDD